MTAYGEEPSVTSGCPESRQHMFLCATHTHIGYNTMATWLLMQTFAFASKAHIIKKQGSRKTVFRVQYSSWHPLAASHSLQRQLKKTSFQICEWIYYEATSQPIMCVTGSDCLSKANGEHVGVSHHNRLKPGLFFWNLRVQEKIWRCCRHRNKGICGMTREWECTTNKNKIILGCATPVARVWSKSVAHPPGKKSNLLWQWGGRGKKMLKDFVSCSCTPDFMLMNIRCWLLCKHHLTVFWEGAGFDI